MHSINSSLKQTVSGVWRDFSAQIKLKHKNMRRQIGFWKLSNFPKKIASLFPRDFVYLNTNNYGNQQFLCKAESGREREDAFIQKEGLGKVSRPRARARRQIKQTKTPNPKQKTHMALPWEGLSLKKKWNGRNKKDRSKCRVVQFMNKLTLLLYDGVFRQQSTIQAITRSTGTHTHTDTGHIQNYCIVFLF